MENCRNDVGRHEIVGGGPIVWSSPVDNSVTISGAAMVDSTNHQPEQEKGE